MSRVIIEDTGQFWVISGDGDIKWQGTVNGLVDLELVGPVDSVTANAVSVFAGSSTTGLHYKTGTVTTFPGYDGLETFTRFAYLAFTFLFLWWLVRVVSSLLSNKNHNIT